jgi:drug/metabolite transporter (DMT)-like permease
MDNLRPNAILTALLTVLALIAFAANSILCRLALGESSIDPASYTAIRLVSGALTLWIIAACRRQAAIAKTASSWMPATMLFLYAVTFSFAYVNLSAGTGALILFASVQIAMIGLGLYSGERPYILEWLGLIIAVGGLCYLVSPGITAPSPLGSFLMASAGVAWGYYSVAGRGNIDPVGATAHNFLRAAPLSLIAGLIWLPSLSISSIGVFWAILSGSLSSGVGYVIWYGALRGLGMTQAATVQLSVPVIAALGGVVFLSEALGMRLIVSTVVILGGVGMAVFSRATPLKQSAGFFDTVKTSFKE